MKSNIREESGNSKPTKFHNYLSYNNVLRGKWPTFWCQLTGVIASTVVTT
jgi:hypothetical protein